MFVLSDCTNPDLRQLAITDTTEDVCEQCENLNSTLAAISEAVAKAPFHTNDDRDEAVYLTNQATLAIQSWKCHLLRSAHQDQARLDIIDALNQETVFIVNDWAMKVLPQRNRESQANWFGKRGISWHISVVYRRIEGVLQWQGFIHVIQSRSQGSSAVVATMHHVLTTLKREHPEISTAFFRQDNAGCHHSSRTILACRHMGTRCGIRVAGIDFSDPQGGQGTADRLAASCKFHIRAYINEGQDVCTANDMKIALISHGGLEGVRLVFMDTIAETQDTAQTIEIKQYLFNTCYYQ